ncbi:transcription-silencing protein Clr2-domain-containing protein [Lasiosphaeria ovina]|uniref:Transcription-silencing protein Clr2-domain-containing protein n=1 Tax=Lasiosphaeria ovina TaxID=92902 RepID=A0AAE0NER9_9PEZI|nr:transcription-silencing protein Clr2-domain-containing protein [Lasiosphaeria ovina]
MANSAAQDDDAKTDYYPITIARSDGKGYSNLDHNPLNHKEDQDIQQLERWEVIIAGHLQNQLGLKDDKRQFKLSSFPKGYELRCAIRKDGGRDYYLYGHPAGPKSNYRTPGDFVLHLLWLVSASTDYSQCSCDLCTRMVEANKQRQPQIPGFELAPPSTASPAPRAIQTPVLPPAPPQSQPKAKAPAQPAAQPQLQQPVQAQQKFSPLVAPLGTTSPLNVFRVGELVWYKHQAWRLGMVMAITLKAGQTGVNDAHYTFTLAPLGHLILRQPTVVKEAIEMRPFLTFSVPNISIAELNDKLFEEVNWMEVAQRHANEGTDDHSRAVNMQMLGLEASKMAARSVNDCFSTFNKLNEAPIGGGSMDSFHSYAGVYFGAEMIRVYDAIRVAAPDADASPAADGAAGATVIMRIAQIQIVDPGSGQDQTLQFRGNLYRTIRTALPFPPSVVAAEGLGPAFAEEVAVRNQIEKDKSMRWGWVLVESDAVRLEAVVHGRFYVMHRLMSIIDRERFQKSLAMGTVDEAQSYLNSRSHSGWSRHVGRKPSRAATVGSAISVQFVPPDGMIEN